MTVNVIASPGKSEIHHALATYSRPSETIRPHVGVEGRTPNPRKLRDASKTIMLATSINLLPVGQLDGGHIVYALFGARVHRIVSIVTFAALIGLGFLSWPILGYQVFALLLLFLRFRHPAPYKDLPGLGPGRERLGLLALLIFILTFMPIPVELIEHVGSL